MSKTTAIVFILGLLVVAEILLRYKFGFCNAVLFREDPDFEYIAMPNQDRVRYGNRIKYNSMSMRSDEVDTTAYVIIGFGDSIINGGMQTDNDSLATTILSDTLSRIMGRKVQFLNVSSETWGPDNAFEYLRKYGHFGAKEFYLFLSSHDAHDTMTFKKIVGVNESYPNKQYHIALFELCGRYLFPRVKAMFNDGISEKEQLAINEKNKEDGINVGLLNFHAYTQDLNIPLTIYLHADRAELEAGTYNSYGQEIIGFAKSSGIPLILDLENGLSPSDFRDELHINSMGQRRMAETVVKHMSIH